MSVKYNCEYLISNINLLDNNYNEEQLAFCQDFFNQNYSFENGVFPTWLHNITQIDEHAFWSHENIVNITIPNNVVSIKQGAFRRCTKLNSITIPSSVTSIGKTKHFSTDGTVFGGCYNLKDIYLHPTTPPSLLGDETYTSLFPSSLTAIHVPIGSGDAYKSATNWSNYADIIVEDIVVE